MKDLSTIEDFENELAQLLTGQLSDLGLENITVVFLEKRIVVPGFKNEKIYGGVIDLSSIFSQEYFRNSDKQKISNAIENRLAAFIVSARNELSREQ